MLRYSCFIVFLVLLLALGCAENAEELETAQESETFRIVATTTQAGDLARVLTAGTSSIELYTLMNAGVDPHVYQPTLGDIDRMNAAHMIIYSGLHLEGQFDRIFESLEEQNVFVHALSRIVSDSGFIISSEDDGGEDPHFWFDPRNWALSAGALAEELAEILPVEAHIILANAEEYSQQLEALNAWAQEAMRSVPEELRALVTSHDAFGYFGDAFGWQTFSIQGLSTLDAVGIADIQDTVGLVLSKGYPVIFVESSIPPDTIEAVIEAVRAGGGRLMQGLRELLSDAMDSPENFAGSYIGMIAHNVYTILQSYEAAGVGVRIPQWNFIIPLPAEYRK